MSFKDHWIKELSLADVEYIIEKAAKLSEADLKKVRETINRLQKRGWISSKIISHMQKAFPKLKEKYKAERAFWTETKKMETTDIKDAGEELEVTKYKILTSPRACDLCKRLTDNGRKTFVPKGMLHKGREIPPIHPNCYCLAVPVA